MGSNNRLSSSSSLVFTNGTLDLNGTSQTVAGLSGAGGRGIVNTSANQATLVVDIATGSQTFGTRIGTPVTTTNITGANNNIALTKTGYGTLTLTGTNTYTGATAVNQGTLVVGVNSIGSITSAVTVASGATLGGSGAITGNVTLSAESGSGLKNGGKLAAGNGPAEDLAANRTTLAVTGDVGFGTGSIFEWQINPPESDPGQLADQGLYGKLSASGAITGASAVFSIVLGVGDSFAEAFWDSHKSWTDIFAGGSGSGTLAAIFSGFSGAGIVSETVESQLRGSVADQGYFTLSGNTLSWQAIPEPSTALAGLLLAAGLLRRRR
jgi:autotransporter-associated beta strand protein